MSYCEIVLFKDGKPYDFVQYENAWGGAAYIWTCLYDKYLKDPHNPYDSWLLNPGSLWDLATDPSVPDYMRSTHTIMFDYATVDRYNFKKLASDFRKFVRFFGTGEGVCHLLDWADFIETCDAEVIGFYPMSVSRNLWWVYDEKIDKEIPYDLNTMDSHFEIYEWLGKNDGG